MNAYNDFGGANEVAIREMPAIEITDNRFRLDLPACCVAEITLK